MCVRYGWRIPNTPSHCQCGEKNSVDYALMCKKGGYVILRHNRLRDLEAELMKEVCTDVRTEPTLLPIANRSNVSGNTTDQGRPDVSGVGVWSPMEKTFIDVRIFHPNAPTYISKDLPQVYKTHEREKKRDYNNRIIQVENASFSPIVLSTFGGMGEEASRFHNRLAKLIADKRNEYYSHVINFIRTRIRFSLLKSVLISLRGIRGRKDDNLAPISSLSYNLIRSD